MRTIKNALYVILFGVLGCTSVKVSPGMTFLVGLNEYQSEMEKLEEHPDRWFDRQRAGDVLKNTYRRTIGDSRQFNKMVDLDVKRREFLITLRESAVKPDRVKDMKEELVVMNRDVDGLKESVRLQVFEAERRARPQPEQFENIATIGLLNIAIDSFSVMAMPESSNPRTTKVGPYAVSDFGDSLAMLRTPEGQIYRCTTLLVPEEGAKVKCEPSGE